MGSICIFFSKKIVKLILCLNRITYIRFTMRHCLLQLRRLNGPDQTSKFIYEMQNKITLLV
jgi:hypothetical protein